VKAEEKLQMPFENDESNKFDMYDEEFLRRRKAIGCCAILIIIIFIVALLVGYTPWFHPFVP
jgi:hypothetical protein